MEKLWTVHFIKPFLVTVTVKPNPTGEICNVMGVTPAGIALISTLAPLGSEVMVTTPSLGRPLGCSTVAPGFNLVVVGAVFAGGPGAATAFGLNPASKRTSGTTSATTLGGSGSTVS